MFSENLKMIRKQRNISQQELADQLHVTRQTISKWERNLSLPDVAVLTELATLLETPVNELIESPVKNTSKRKQRHPIRLLLIIISFLIVGFLLLSLLIAIFSFDTYTTHTRLDIKELQEPIP